MPGLYKKKRHYYGVFYAPDRAPQQKWVALRTRDRKVAAAKLRELEYRHVIGEWDPWVDASPQAEVSIEGAIAAFEQARRMEDLSPNTLRGEMSTLQAFARHLPKGVLISSINENHVRSFLTARRADGCKNSSLQSYHTRLAHFFTWCVAGGYIRASPMQNMKRPRKARRSVAFLSEEEVELLLGSIRHEGDHGWLSDVVQIAVGTGLRLSELCAMRWDWIDRSTRAITVRRSAGFRPKSHHERHVPIAGAAVAVIERLSRERTQSSPYVLLDDRGRQLSPTRVSKAFKRHVRLGGLSESYTFHTLRHTYASWLVKSGADLYRVKELLGHADIETTQRYAHLRPESLRSAVQKAFGDTSGLPISGSSKHLNPETNYNYGNSNHAG